MIRRRRFADLLRLEDRITPTFYAVGPLTSADFALFHQLGGDDWQVTSIMSSGLTAVANVNRLTAALRPAPMEFTTDKPRVIVLPRPEGGFERFEIRQSTMMDPGLAAQFPTIKTYRGQSLDRPANQMAADVGPNGFHATIVGPGSQWSIAPVALGSASYRVEKLSGPLHGGGCSCGVCQLAAANATPPSSAARYSSGPTLRTFRFAVAATGEYYAFSGGTLAGTQANIVTVVNTVNLLFERDFTVRLVLVANNSDLIFSNAATDPYTGDNAFAMLDQNQATVDSKIGLANYDLGFVFSAGNFGGGVAYLRGIQQPWRASGASIAPTFGTPTGLGFTTNVAHEIGHQLGALHSFNGVNGAANGNRVAQTAVEVGSGSSIMAYPGISGADDLQSVPDLFYHSISYDQVRDFIDSLDVSIGSKITTNNAAPTVFAGLDAAIPANTPFALTAASSDANGDAITYSWEERDLGPAQALGSADNGRSPIFRAFAPVSGGTRTFPNLTNLLANTASKGETLPTTNRTLDFRVEVRDSKLSGGGVNGDDLSLAVVNTGSPFKVTSPNTATSLGGGSSQIITWDVAGTTAAPISTATVNIRLSTDGGLTWPTLLATATANDGNEIVTLPTTTTAAARVRVEAVGNYFFDVSNADFAITAASSQFVTSMVPNPSGATFVDFTFAQAVNGTTVGVGDLVLSAGTVASATLQSSTVVRYSLQVSAEVPVTITLPSNAVSSTGGAGNRQFIGTYAADAVATTGVVPLNAFSQVGTLGTAVYETTRTGAIGFVADRDEYSIDHDAGQWLTVTVTPSATVRPTLTITRNDGNQQTVTAPQAGQAVTLIASNPFFLQGFFTISISSNNTLTGSYSLTALLNAAVESEPNNSTGQAQSTSIGFVLHNGVTHIEARGRTDAFTNFLTTETEPNHSPGVANDASFSFVPYSGNLYQMGIGADFDFSDWWNIGQLQPGDFLTYATYGAASGRGMLGDPGANVYYGPNGFYAAGDDNSGNGLDALLYRYGVDFTDNYYVTGYGNGTFGQTYQVGLLLENGGLAPSTGGGVPSDSEPNNGPAEAIDASTSWRPVQYRSAFTGTISPVGESDYFKYQFNAGDLVTFIGDSMSDADLQIYLRSSVGTVLASDDGSNAGLAADEDATIYAYRIPSAGSYYVEVKSKANTGGYQLVGLLSAAAPPPVAAATADFYRPGSLVPAGTQQMIALKALNPGNITVDVVDINNVVLASAIPGPTNYDRILNFTSPTTANVLLRVSGDPGIDYVLTYVNGVGIDFEPNDIAAAAQPLTNKMALGGITANDEDWYSTTAVAGTNLVVTTLRPAGPTLQFVNNLDPNLELYSADGTLVASDDNSGPILNAKIVYVAPTTGTYRIRVRGTGGTTGEYIVGTPADPPPTITSLTINAGAVQRSRVTEVSLAFNEIINLPANAASAFQLLRQGGTPADTVTLAAAVTTFFTYRSVKLTFSGPFTDSGSLADGKYTLTAFASMITDPTGQALDGDFNSLAGGDYVLVGNPATNKLYRLFGDADGDNDIDNTDFVAFRTAFGTGATIFDFDGDADTDNADFVAFRTRFGTTIP